MPWRRTPLPHRSGVASSCCWSRASAWWPSATTYNRPTLTGATLAANYITVVIIRGGDIEWVWFVLPAVGYLMLLGAEGRVRVSQWGRSATPSSRHHGVPETSSLARSGRQAGAIALVSAVLIPALLPALSEGLVEGGMLGGGGGGGRTIRVDNPIVDLQRNLNQQQDVTVLRYETESQRREYIRAATNDVFDGEKWSLSQRDVPTSQRVNEGVVLPDPPGLATDEYGLDEYRFELTDDYSWLSLPMVYPPRTIRIDETGGGGEPDFRFAADTLDVHDGNEDPRGTEYTQQAIVVEHDPETLRRAPDAGPEFAAMTELPDGMAESLEPYIDEAIGDLTNKFEQASALQAWFRTEGGFDYDIEVPDSGTSAGELINFLEVRVGFCQQYSTAMAVMARALDIPARVAVGFTPGEQIRDNEWVVRGQDAHAWPELYFEGAGWVRFEPTPAGRTGVAPEWTQLPSDDNAVVPDPAPSAALDQFPEDVAFPEGLDQGGGVTGSSGGLPDETWPIAGGVLGLTLIVSLPWSLAWLRRELRWRRAAGDPIAEAEAAWVDLREAAADCGLGWSPSSTPRAVSRQLATDAGLYADARSLLGRITLTTERARYAPTADHLPSLKGDAADLRSELLAVAPRMRRLQAFMWPSGTRGLLGAAGNRMGDWLEGLEAANIKLRERVTSLLPARR
jgi:transglutaminase-like putative cysteine protease